ncbi:hypothetical protein JKP88DRAFT_310714 [Tribonema minus]|uniref:Uncharacterized protein n=1 Tax=Tribonema minus TaxID=303371 RepID=A0A836CGR9_9STRA|nr:hypothetical protein JKP88DRAFT_310714 [Tribonema minus]
MGAHPPSSSSRERGNISNDGMRKLRDLGKLDQSPFLRYDKLAEQARRQGRAARKRALRKTVTDRDSSIDASPRTGRAIVKLRFSLSINNDRSGAPSVPTPSEVVPPQVKGQGALLLASMNIQLRPRTADGAGSSSGGIQPQGLVSPVSLYKQPPAFSASVGFMSEAGSPTTTPAAAAAAAAAAQQRSGGAAAAAAAAAAADARRRALRREAALLQTAQAACAALLLDAGAARRAAADGGAARAREMAWLAVARAAAAAAHLARPLERVADVPLREHEFAVLSQWNTDGAAAAAVDGSVAAAAAAAPRQSCASSTGDLSFFRDSLESLSCTRVRTAACRASSGGGGGADDLSVFHDFRVCTPPPPQQHQHQQQQQRHIAFRDSDGAGSCASGSGAGGGCSAAAAAAARLGSSTHSAQQQQSPDQRSGRAQPATFTWSDACSLGGTSAAAAPAGGTRRFRCAHASEDGGTWRRAASYSRSGGGGGSVRAATTLAPAADAWLASQSLGSLSYTLGSLGGTQSGTLSAASRAWPSRDARDRDLDMELTKALAHKRIDAALLRKAESMAAKEARRVQVRVNVEWGDACMRVVHWVGSILSPGWNVQATVPSKYDNRHSALRLNAHHAPVLRVRVAEVQMAAEKAKHNALTELQAGWLTVLVAANAASVLAKRAAELGAERERRAFFTSMTCAALCVQRLWRAHYLRQFVAVNRMRLQPVTMLGKRWKLRSRARQKHLSQPLVLFVAREAAMASKGFPVCCHLVTVPVLMIVLFVVREAAIASKVDGAMATFRLHYSRLHRAAAAFVRCRRARITALLKFWVLVEPEAKSRISSSDRARAGALGPSSRALKAKQDAAAAAAQHEELPAEVVMIQLCREQPECAVPPLARIRACEAFLKDMRHAHVRSGGGGGGGSSAASSETASGGGRNKTSKHTVAHALQLLQATNEEVMGGLESSSVRSTPPPLMALYAGGAGQRFRAEVQRAVLHAMTASQKQRAANAFLMGAGQPPPSRK